jgi:CDP-glucose 4,6-dehydratase
MSVTQASPGDNHWRGRRVFITGATGLLGSHLTESLVREGADVVALVRDGVPRALFHEAGLDAQVVTVRGEIEDFDLLERALNEHEIETVFHLAAQTIVGHANRSPLATFRANIEGTWNLLEACRQHSGRVKRIVIASSDKAYGDLKGEAYDETFPLRGEHPYDVSKSCADLLARSYYRTYGLPVAITRCGNFFGPGDLNFSRLIPGVIRDALAGHAPVIRSDGTLVRDYLFAGDGAQAYLRLASQMTGEPAKHSGEAFNFSYGLRLSVRDVALRVLAALGLEKLGLDVRSNAPNEIPVQCLDSAKARRELGWKPEIGFDEGLKRTVEWYRGRIGR